MKKCTSCFSEIDDQAKKCQHCTADQGKKYRVMRVIAPLLPMLIMLWIFRGIFWGDVEFVDHQESISSELTSQRENDGNQVFIYQINNQTKYKWEDLVYTLKVYDDKDELLDVHNGKEYSWAVQPNSTGLISIKPSDLAVGARYEFEITDLRTSLY